MTRSTATWKFLITAIIATATVGIVSPAQVELSLATLTGVAFLVSPITQFFKERFNLKEKTIKIIIEIKTAQVVSWGVGMTLGLISWFLKIGYFAELPHFYQALIAGMGAALASNGIFEIEAVKAWLETIFKRSNDNTIQKSGQKKAAIRTNSYN